MKDDHEHLKSGIEYAKRLEGQENLSPNELRIIALAKEVARLQTELRRVNVSRKPQ